jgi:molybdenum cofactor cytidylyltransferase
MIAGLILAAGESSRMGQDKALLRYRGRTFLESALATLHDAGIDRVTVVLGHHAEEIQRAVNIEGTEIVINPDYRRGQTSSLQAGLKALCVHPLLCGAAAVSPMAGVRWSDSDRTRNRTSPSGGEGDMAATREVITPTLEAVVLCLVDHPAVSVEVVRKLVSRFEVSHAAVVIPTCQGRRGHPVLIGRALFEELRSLGSDQGANSVIRKYRDATQWLEVDDLGILLDVDDPDTYRRLQSHPPP